MSKHLHPLKKTRPSRKAQGNFSVSFLAQSPIQRERNFRGIELARQALAKSHSEAECAEGALAGGRVLVIPDFSANFIYSEGQR